MSQKVVLITGTSTGIGEACVARQAAAGWRVYAGVRKPEDGERLVSSISGDVVPVIIDVTKRDDIDRVLEQIDAEAGLLHGLVSNAGIAVGGPVETLTDEEWRWQFDGNFFSLVTLSRTALPLMDKGNGRFVHVGSIAGRVATAGLGPYAASKFAVQAFNWVLRAELAQNTRMSSSVVEPGEIKTAIWDKTYENMLELEQLLESQGLMGRYGHLVEGQRGFIAEGRAKGCGAGQGGRRRRACSHRTTAKTPLPRWPGRSDDRGARQASGPPVGPAPAGQRQTPRASGPQARRDIALMGLMTNRESL